MANGLNFRQYQALSALKAQNETFGGWVFWGPGVDAQAMHQLIKRDYAALRYTPEGLAQLAITMQGADELRRAVAAFNGAPAARPVEVRL